MVRNPSSSEVISFSYSSAFVCYSAGRSRIRRKKTKCGKCQGRFLHAGAFMRERTGIIVFCIVRTFASTVLLVQFSLCRTLATVVHCIMVYIYTNNHHHPYIDSTTMLSDTKYNNCTYLRFIFILHLHSMLKQYKKLIHACNKIRLKPEWKLKIPCIYTYR